MNTEERILVVGDSILDIYSYGNVDRVSPEAACFVLDHSYEERILGGACNTAANIRSLSKLPDLKIDYFGFTSLNLSSMFKDYRIECVGIPIEEDEILQKKRYVCKNQQLLRVDNRKLYDDKGHRAISSMKFKNLDFSKYDLIVVSDYDKGTLTSGEFEILSDLQIPTIIDLKRVRKCMPNFRGSPCIMKCNEKELDENPFVPMLADKVVVTLGSKGYSMPNTKETFPATNRTGKVIDVIGAGDSFLAGMATQFIESKDFDEYKMAAFGNRVAGEKVKHFGTLAVDRKELQ